jgi:hypothetical protein
MARLNAPVQLAIVQALACYDTPTEVAAKVKADFGLDVTRQQIATYDHTKAAGRNVSAKLRAVFDASRQAFLTDMQDIPISHLSVRLRMLQRLLEKAEERGNVAMAVQLLEQAAKECGGMFTNRREFMGKGGAPIALASRAELISPEALAEAVRTVRDAFYR